MDEFSALVPAGVVLKSIKQADNIVVTGYAQSNARVSEFLHKLTAQGRWLVQPDLIEIKSASVGQGKDLRKIVEFTLTVGLARLSPETP
jgi:type IV pilus assembly protein PilN